MIMIKVADKLWGFNPYSEKIEPCFVSCMLNDDKDQQVGFRVFYAKKYGNIDNKEFKLDDVGHIIFTDKKTAKKALADYKYRKKHGLLQKGEYYYGID